MKKKQVLLIDAVLAVSGLLAGLAAKIMLTYINIPGCPLLTKTGIPCPVCGGTRCVLNFVKGNFYEAFMFNQYVFLILVYLVILFVVFNIRHLTNNRIAAKTLKFMCDYRVMIAWTLCWPVFWVLRATSVI